MAKPAERILFLTMKIAKDTIDGTTKITKQDVKIVDGTFKDRSEDNVHSETSLTVEVFEHQELISSTTMDHPLYKDVEYTTDNNKFVRSMISLTEAEFFVRVQLHSTASQIKIFETIEGKPKQELYTIEL